MRRYLGTVLVGTLLSILGAACDRARSDDSSGEKVAAPEPSGRALGKLEKALASAVTAAGTAPNAGAAAGPPEDGIMEPARAAAELAADEGVRVTLGGSGSSPTRVLARAPLPPTSSAKLTVEMEVGPGQIVPAMEIALAFTADKLKGEGLKAVQAVTARVTGVGMGTASVPEDFKKQVAGLAGSQIRFTQRADGAAYGYVAELGPTTPKELVDLLDAVVDGLTQIFLPTPSEAVGKGAVWMAVSREVVAKVPFLAYRMIKVTELTEKELTLEYTTRRYAIGRMVDATALGSPDPLELREVTSNGEGRLTMNPSSALPKNVESEATLRALLKSPTSPGQRVLQAGGRYRFEGP